jgi:hypothetical protein
MLPMFARKNLRSCMTPVIFYKNMGENLKRPSESCINQLYYFLTQITQVLQVLD